MGSNHHRSPFTRRLLEQVRLACLCRRYCTRTAQAYVYWVRDYALFRPKRHPASSGPRTLRPT